MNVHCEAKNYTIFCNNFVKSFFLSAGCLTNCHSEVATTRQYLAQNFNRFALIALPWYCNLRRKVGNVRKSQVRCYNWSLASRDKAARWLCVHDALARCTWSRQRQIPEGRAIKYLLISQSAIATVVTAVHQYVLSQQDVQWNLCTTLIITVTRLTYDISGDKLMKK